MLAAVRRNPDLEVPQGRIPDRARYGLYPPGSSFKIVTAIAALRKDPRLTAKCFDCVWLPDGRVGNFIGNSRRPIRDDIKDANPHGSVDMSRGVAVSCNAYFAQLGTLEVGAAQLLVTAEQFDIATALAQPRTAVARGAAPGVLRAKGKW
jgi:cell division protein FtsI/penicillin-binding protein 2